VLSGELDNTGKFVVLFSDNNTITPPGTFWRFTIQPLASVSPSVVDIVITGGAMNISSLLTSKISAPRFALTGDSFGYADVEVLPPPIAGVANGYYVNTTTGAMRVWNGQSFVNQGGGTQTGNLAGTTRVLGTVYQNTSPGMMYISVTVSIGTGSNGNGTLICYSDSANSASNSVIQLVSAGQVFGVTRAATFMVPRNFYYKVTDDSTTHTLTEWVEWTQ